MLREQVKHGNLNHVCIVHEDICWEADVDETKMDYDLKGPDHLNNIFHASVCEQDVQKNLGYQAPEKGYVAYEGSLGDWFWSLSGLNLSF